jgi:Sulfotransferase domain
VGEAWPNLFIPGAPKAGTTSLWRYLSAHPEIYMSPVKEPGFLSRDPGGGGIRDEETYLRLFAAGSAHRWRGEATIAYFTDPTSPDRIKSSSPGSKIIIMLRDPVERAYSDYWYFVRREQEERSFREAVDQVLSGRPLPRGTVDYIERSSYVPPLERYFDAFGDNVLVLFQEELRDDPQGELDKLYEFLGLDAAFARDIAPQAQNRFEVPRNGLAARVVRARPLLAVGRRLPMRPRRKLVELATVRRTKPKMDPETRNRLRALYEPERRPLERMLGRTLPW